MPMWLLGFGATWRDIDYKGNLYGRTKDRNEQYDATAAWGDEKLRVTGIGNWGKIRYDQAYLAGQLSAADTEQLHELRVEQRRTRRTGGWARCWSTGHRATSGR